MNPIITVQQNEDYQKLIQKHKNYIGSIEPNTFVERFRTWLKNESPKKYSFKFENMTLNRIMTSTSKTESDYYRDKLHLTAIQYNIFKSRENI